MRWSRDHQARELILWVAEDNPPARRLYARVGFRPAGARQPLPSNSAVDEVLLRLPLEAVDLAGVRAAEPDPRLLDGVVGLGERAEHPVGHARRRGRFFSKPSASQSVRCDKETIMQAPSGQMTAPALEALLEALLKDGALAGEWVLDPRKSSIRLKNRAMWGGAVAFSQVEAR